MVITVWTDGDSSVGMEGDLLNIEWNAVSPFDGEEREEARKQLAAFFSEFLGEPAKVAFGDDPQEPEEDEPEFEPDFEPFQEMVSPGEIARRVVGAWNP